VAFLTAYFKSDSPSSLPQKDTLKSGWSLWVDLYWLMMAVAVDKDDHPQYQYSRGWVRVTKEIVVVSPWRRYYARRSMTADEDIPFVGETLSW